MRVLRSTNLCFTFGFGLAVAACGGSRQECEQRITTLTTALAEIPEGSLILNWPVDTLVTLDDAVAAERDVEGLLIYADPKGALDPDFMAPIKMTSVAEARSGLQYEIEKAVMRGNSGRVVLVASYDARWNVIATLFAGLVSLGQTEVDLVFARDTKIPPTPPSAVTEELLEIRRESNDTRMLSFSNVAEKLVEPCAPFGELLIRVGRVEPDQRLQTLVTGTPEAMRACDCKADVESVTAFVHAIVTPDFVPAVVRIRLAPSSESTEELALPGDMLWQEAYLRVLETRDRPTRYTVQTD